MAYLIYQTNGNLLTTVSEQTANTTATSLSLIGRSYLNYGQALNTDLVWMLENFADSSPPPNALLGQLWYDSAQNVLQLNGSGSWAPIAAQAWVAQNFTAVGSTITLSGDATGSAPLGNPTTDVAVTLSDTGVIAGTYDKFVVDAKGRITAGLPLTANDVETALGFVPANINGSANENFSANELSALTVTAPTMAGSLVTGQVIDAPVGSFSNLTVDTIAVTTAATAPTPAAGDNSTNVATTAFVDQAVATGIAQQSITLAGDASGTLANGTLTATLAATGVAAGSYTQVTVDTKGRVLSGIFVQTGVFGPDSFVSQSASIIQLTSAHFGCAVALTAPGSSPPALQQVVLPPNTEAYIGARIRITRTTTDGSATITTSDGSATIDSGNGVVSSITLFGGETADLWWSGASWVASGSFMARLAGHISWDVSAPPAADFLMAVGQKVTITYSNVAAIPFNIASSGGLYRATNIFTSSNTVNSDLKLEANNTTYTGAFSWYGFASQDVSITSFGTATAGPGTTPYQFPTTGSFGATMIPTAEFQYKTMDFFYFDQFGGPTTVDTYFDIGTSVQEFLISTYTASKIIKASGGIAGGGFVGFSKWEDTTTAWTSIGTLSDNGGNSLSGVLVVERLA